jgi:dipeptidyl aminopeptidase/acylaminoacyl peptidase
MENNLFKSGVLLFALGSMSCISLWAQGTVEDYNRAYALREKYNAKHVLYAGVVPHWVDQTSAFWYVRQTEKGKEYVKVDAASKKRTALFDQQKMASALTEKAGREINAYNLPLQNCRLNISLDTLRFQLDGKFWAYSIKNNRLLDEGAIPSRGKERHWMEVDDEKEGSPVTSPDGKWTAFIKNDNVYVREVATGKEKQLSQDGTLSNYYSSYIQWSPDSKSVVSCRIRPVEKRYVYYVESSPADQAQPKLHKQEYAKPGDELRFKVPCIFEVESGRRLIPSTELFSHQYELSGPMWNADSKAITFEYNERGHKVYRVLEMSAVDGSVRTLIEEKEEKYVNYPRIYRNYLSDGKRIIWSSERDNYNHLYLYDRATGKPLNQITKGEWYVRGVQHVDEANEVIYFSANGMKKGEDPYLIHYYKINFDGSNLVELTPEEGMHQCWYSSDYKYLVDVYSKVDQAPIAVLRDAKNGKIRMQLDKADISALLANGWKAPEVFSAKGRDGKTDMWGVIYRPSNFDPSKKYPVIEYIYSGPGDRKNPYAAG